MPSQLGYLPSADETAGLETRRQAALARFRQLGTLSYDQDQADRAELQRRLDDLEREKKKAARNARRAALGRLGGTIVGGLAGIPGGPVGVAAGAGIGGAVGGAAFGGGSAGLDDSANAMQNLAMMYASRQGQNPMASPQGLDSRSTYSDTGSPGSLRSDTSSLGASPGDAYSEFTPGGAGYGGVGAAASSGTGAMPQLDELTIRRMREQGLI
jgi:hypothetical protein